MPALPLHEKLWNRQIETGLQLISASEAQLWAMPAEDPSAPYLAYVLSGWGQYSPTALAVARKLARAYSEGSWPRLCLEDCARIEVAGAWLAFHDRRDADVDSALKWLGDNKARLKSCTELLASAALIGCLSHKRRAGYLPAGDFVEAAIEGYGQAGLPLMVAVAQVSKGWLQMQAGNLNAANQTWDAADTALTGTDDWTTLANISFSRSRCLCRAGRNDVALGAYRNTIALYTKRPPFDRNLRRACVELANLLHRMAGTSDSPQADQYRADAVGALSRTARLLGDDKRDDVRNRIRLALAEVHQALAKVEPSQFAALAAAQSAYDLAKGQGDKLMTARALLELAGIQAKFAELSDEPKREIVAAYRNAIDASEWAEGTSDNRLKARIETFRGTLLLGGPFDDLEAAEKSLVAAERHMARRQDHDYVSAQITELKNEITRRASSNGTGHPSRPK